MFTNPNNTQLPSDCQALYDKIKPVTRKSTYVHKDTSILITKDPFWSVIPKDGDMTHSFLFYDSETPSETHTFQDCVSVTKYCYHTAGYQGFFKPSLDEVIKCAADVIRDCDYVYVTSVPCDINGKETAEINECFDQSLWCHMGKVTLWPVFITAPSL